MSHRKVKCFHVEFLHASNNGASHQVNACITKSYFKYVPNTRECVHGLKF